MPEGLPIAKGKQDHLLLPRMANRHGLIAGATGTGKTVTLRVIAEHLSRIGVPVFMADVKGDLSGIAHPGQETQKSRNASQSLESKTSSTPATLPFSGIFTASRAIPCGRPFLIWAPC